MSEQLPVPRKAAPPPALPRNRALGEVIGAFESDTAAVFARTTPRSEHLILYALSAFIAMAVVFAALVSLERVVTGPGVIQPSGGVFYVSPFDTGIVRQILVKPGDMVRKGQTLATLDPTFTEADLQQLEQKLASTEAAMARLRAESQGRAYGAGKGSAKPAARDGAYDAMQAELFVKRQAEFTSNLADFDSRIRATEAQIAQQQADVTEYAKRLKLATDTEKAYEPLHKDGYVSKLQMNQASDQRAEMTRLLGSAQNQIATLRQNIDALRAQRKAFVEKWQSDTSRELVAASNELDSTRQQLEKARKMRELVTLTAPADGVVLKIGKLSSGSVAGNSAPNAGAEPLFTLVPLDVELEAVMQIPPEHVGFVKVGDPVQVKLDAYRYIKHGTAKGVIKTLSEGSFNTDTNNAPTPTHFRVTVAIKEVKLQDVPADFRLIPGMTLVGDILVGERTLLSYLVEGGLRTGKEAMREP